MHTRIMRQAPRFPRFKPAGPDYRLFNRPWSGPASLRPTTKWCLLVNFSEILIFLPVANMVIHWFSLVKPNLPLSRASPPP